MNEHARRIRTRAVFAVLAHLAAGVSYANAGALDKLLAELPKPVLVHCSTGNRAGALLALRAKANGADARSALELGVANGLAGLKPVVEEKLNAGHD
jgi:protein tyrosine phosphatase (PTP) superfamily phosphohydrolase (DUF442 family)